MRTRGGAQDVGEDIGPYRFATRIAVGGMAEVFRALRRQSAGADRAVVLKRMLPTLLEEPEWREMFEHEARLGLRIRHQNVVEVLDHDVDQGAPYLVLEYVFGVDLRRLAAFLARNRRPLRPPLAVWLVSELLAGLHAVHSARDDRGASLGIVHRDVSPSNVFLSVHGDVKLGDLGIAQAALRESPRTPHPREAEGRAALVKGKLGYLAPEQVAGLPIDQRADVFAAATILAELLLGRPLFSGGTELGVLLAIRDADLAPLREIAACLPSGLFDVVSAALTRDPAARTPDGDTLRRALLEHTAGEPEAELRRELGALVVAALDAGEADTDIDRTSLAHTREHVPESIVAGARVRSERPPSAFDQALQDHARFFDLESPGASFGPSYELRDGTRRLGPWPYARVVQALRSAEIHGAYRVRVDGGEERAITEIDALARHLHPTPMEAGTPRLPMAQGLSKDRLALRAEHSRWTQTSESFDLAEGGIARVLIAALRAQETGLLLCEHEGTRKEVYLDRGVPTFVASNRVEELLGERLVAARVVDRAELDLALAVMPRFEGRLGDTLVALGLAPPLVIFRHIALHAREKLLDVFTWPGGRAALHRRVDAPDRSFPLRLDAWELLEAGILRRIEAGLEPRGRFSGRVLEPTADDPMLPERFRPLVELLAIPRSLIEVEDALGDRDRSYAAVLALVEAGTLRWSPPIVPE